MSRIRYTTATDGEILRSIGVRLRALRESQELTQKEVALRAGIGRKTLFRAEQGENPTLETVIRLLRAYGRLAALEDFIPEPEISPMARLREREGERGG